MGIDFGGFGKEFAVDRVIEIAQEHNIENIIVNFGGDLRTLGSPPDSDHWVVGIENPNQPGQARFTLLANNLAVATSGNYQRFLNLVVNVTVIYWIIEQVTPPHLLTYLRLSLLIPA